MQASQSLQRLVVTADEDTLVADAGLVVTATLAQRLGLGALVDQRLPRVAHAGDKALTVISSALAGGDCIDDTGALRAGATRAVLGHRVAAPSTVGTFLRSLGWGQARQLDAVTRQLLARAVGAGVMPRPAPGTPLVVDIDATLVTTYGLAKRGGSQVMRTGRRGYHPLLAVAAGTGQVLHARLRRGRTNDASGAGPFVTETLSRVVSAGLADTGGAGVVLRADSGFYLAEVLDACAAAGARFCIGARMLGKMRAAITALAEDAWTPVPYFEPGAAVAELAWDVFDQRHQRDGRYTGGHARRVRLLVRRTPTPPGLRDQAQHTLFPTYEYHPFITDCDGDPVELDTFCRAHAEVELAIRDLKYGVGGNHLPTKSFAGNHAWLVLQTTAHNLARWAAHAGRLATTARPCLKTLRARVLCVPARLVTHARQQTLRLPRHWPWAQQILTALQLLRALPGPAG